MRNPHKKIAIGVMRLVLVGLNLAGLCFGYAHAEKVLDKQEEIKEEMHRVQRKGQKQDLCVINSVLKSDNNSRDSHFPDPCANCPFRGECF